jgi:pilus assembly protein Flp/PilA
MQDLVASFPVWFGRAGVQFGHLDQLRQPRVDHGANQMKNLLVRFAKDDSGATAIEYGLIAAGIAVAIIAVVNGVGKNLTNTFGTISSDL